MLETINAFTRGASESFFVLAGRVEPRSYKGRNILLMLFL